VNSLERYIEFIVQPTFDDFSSHPGSVRHAYLACLAIYHAVDRASFPAKPGNLLENWRRRSLEFRLVEEVALHFKHVKSNAQKQAEKTLPADTLTLAHPLGLTGDGEGLETRNLRFVLRDAISFLRQEADTNDSGR
jgi:hypothetical protein